MRFFVFSAGALLTLTGLCLVFFTDWSLTGLTVAAVGFLTMLFAPIEAVKLAPVPVVPVQQVGTRVRLSRLELPVEWEEAFEFPVAQIPDSFFTAVSESQRQWI